MVKCNKCGEIKPKSEYRKPSINKCGTKGICKMCKSKIDSKYWSEKLKDDEFKQRHLDRQWKYKAKKQEYQKKYDALNRNKKLEYQRTYLKNNPSAKAIQLVRTRIWHFLKSKYRNKEQSTLETLGCSAEEYKQYLEEHFTKEMTWENHGEYWEIDHIIPLCQSGSFHYTNTRPLEKTKNRSRKKKSNTDASCQTNRED